MLGSATLKGRGLKGYGRNHKGRELLLGIIGVPDGGCEYGRLEKVPDNSLKMSDCWVGPFPHTVSSERILIKPAPPVKEQALQMFLRYCGHPCMQSHGRCARETSVQVL